MKNPEISICIPVYNVEKYIERCIQSILKQTFQDYEVILVDDASTDKSIKIASEFQKKDNRIRIIHKEQNEGVMKARRTGYENANGKYIFFCDSDDSLPDDSLSALYARAKDTGSEIIVGNFIRLFKNGKSQIYDRSSKAVSIEEYRKAIMSGTLCSLWGILFQASLFKGYEYTDFYNQSFSEDRILLVQILDFAHSITSTDAITYIYYLNSDSITQTKFTITRLKEQIFARSWCYEWNQRYPELEYFNNRWFLNSLSYYIESGYNVKDLLNPEKFSKDYLSFKSIKKYTGLRLSIHTYLCMYLKPYQVICATSRKIIRKTREIIKG